MENSLSAAEAAVAANYGIEVDLQLSSDGEAMVFHDEALDRLTAERGLISERTANELQVIKLGNSGDTVPTLSDLLRVVAGRTPLILELKSAFNGDERLAAKVAETLVSYAGPVAVMSFDPAIVRSFRALAPGLPRGIVAERWYSHPDWNFLSFWRKQYMGMLLHIFDSKPHFVAYGQFDLPAVGPFVAQHLFGMKMLSWTVRTEKERARVHPWTQQVIFEFIRP